MKTDIAIIGGGPAGAAAAIALARQGISCVVIEPGWRAKAGECVYPIANMLFSRLGLDDPACEGRRKTAGMRVIWNAPEIEHDYITNAHGVGWTIDRVRFEAALRVRAKDTGATWIDGRFASVEGAGPFSLLVTRASGALVIEARSVLDASGRAAAFARRRGAKRVFADRLIALHARSAAQLDDPRLVIEAVDGGWWYSAGLPDGAVVSFQTRDANMRVPSVWGAETARRFCGATLTHARRFAAGSARLNAIGGEGWLAIGDAAVAHDPLSGHGIAAALASGMDGADAMAAWLGGDRNALAAHAAKRDAAWAPYLAGLNEQYARLPQT